ncbi:MAG: transporter substrate-binding domain-containing protein [Rhodospirillales bacterium]|nr:transporter substrate-binding domain-containing protein [Rhodospirillales bacterium]
MTKFQSAGESKNNNKGRNVLVRKIPKFALVVGLCGLWAELTILPVRAEEPSTSLSQDGKASSERPDNFLLLQTNLHPPYQEVLDGTLGGYSVSVLNCAFERIGVGYGLAVAPRQRNREMVQNGRADGFFLARISEFMDEYAVASNPLALEKWVWVSSSEQVSDRQLKRVPKPSEYSTIGAILGSNEAEWLIEEGYGDVTRVPSIASLVGQVAAGRVDFALVDKQSFEIARNELDIGAEKFVVQFERYAPLVVYFSKRYTEKFPNLLADLNGVLEFCEIKSMHLEPWERDAIERVQLPMVRQLAKSSELIRNVNAVRGSGRLPADQKQLVDDEWTAMGRLGQSSARAREILGNDLSEYLRAFQTNTGDQVAEAFVFDVYGQIIGMSRLTSDFDQSDEQQYQMVEYINRDHALIADIQFDASTRSFLSQITIPIIDPNNGQILAALTVGLDVSAALRPES